jgi:gliding motility-associated-like protein
MRLPLLLVLLFFHVLNTYPQNLVANGNFEEYVNCPEGISDFTTLNWTSPFWPGTPDYFNVCNNGELNIPLNEFGSQESLTGSAYVGIYTYGSQEFIQGVLTSPTIEGYIYELTIIYSPADNFGHSNGLGMLLSAGPPTNYMSQIPQMKKDVIVDNQSEWHTLTIEYLSPGGETHVTIGNFNNENNSNFIPEGMYQDNAYYYIDSIAVKCIGTPSSDIVLDLGDDIQLCEDDYPFTISSNIQAAYNEWSTGETGTSIEVNTPGTYIVKSIIDCRFGTDTIIITTAKEEFCTKEILYIPNVFSPNNDSVNDYFSISYSKKWLNTKIKFSIYNRWGELVFYSEDPNFKWFGDFKGEALNPDVYVYYYEIEGEINGEIELLIDSGDITIIK